MDNLTCEKVSKKYGKTEVLMNIDLQIEKGKIYGLIGRNGAGKTTLLSIMSAQNPSTSGSVKYNGQTVWENDQALSNICFSREISPITAFGANAMKAKTYLQAASVFFSNWDKEYADELINLFELDTKKRLSKMSKGMLSAMTIVIALASKSEITFLDEPVAGLDVVARDLFYKQIIEEYARTGRTFVISTHIIEEAADIFEDVIFLKNGELLLNENTQELLERTKKISGSKEEVDAATAGMEVYHVEELGRSKSVVVMQDDSHQVDQSRDVEIQSVSLQNLFLARCC